MVRTPFRERQLLVWYSAGFVGRMMKMGVFRWENNFIGSIEGRWEGVFLSLTARVGELDVAIGFFGYSTLLRIVMFEKALFLFFGKHRYNNIYRQALRIRQMFLDFFSLH